MSKGNHFGFAQARQLRGAGNGGRLNAEEGRKHMVLAGVVLIRREPDRAPGSQASDHGAGIVARNCKPSLYVPLPAAALYPVVHGVFVGAIQTVQNGRAHVWTPVTWLPRMP